MSFDGLLNKLCTIQVKTETEDPNSGQRLSSWAPLVSIKCRLDIMTGGKVTAPEAIYSKASHILFIRKPAGINIDNDNYRIVIDGKNYEIILVVDLFSAALQNHQELLIKLTE